MLSPPFVSVLLQHLTVCDGTDRVRALRGACSSQTEHAYRGMGKPVGSAPLASAPHLSDRIWKLLAMAETEKLSIQVPRGVRGAAGSPSLTYGAINLNRRSRRMVWTCAAHAGPARVRRAQQAIRDVASEAAGGGAGAGGFGGGLAAQATGRPWAGRGEGCGGSACSPPSRAGGRPRRAAALCAAAAASRRRSRETSTPRDVRALQSPPPHRTGGGPRRAAALHAAVGASRSREMCTQRAVRALQSPSPAALAEGRAERRHCAPPPARRDRGGLAARAAMGAGKGPLTGGGGLTGTCRTYGRVACCLDCRRRRISLVDCLSSVDEKFCLRHSSSAGNGFSKCVSARTFRATASFKMGLVLVLIYHEV